MYVYMYVSIVCVGTCIITHVSYIIIMTTINIINYRILLYQKSIVIIIIINNSMQAYIGLVLVWPAIAI